MSVYGFDLCFLSGSSHLTMKTLRILVILLFTLLVITTAQTPPIQIGRIIPYTHSTK